MLRKLVWLITLSFLFSSATVHAKGRVFFRGDYTIASNQQNNPVVYHRIGF